jgi:hypothetical protein
MTVCIIAVSQGYLRVRFAARVKLNFCVRSQQHVEVRAVRRFVQGYLDLAPPDHAGNQGIAAGSSENESPSGL